LGSRCSSSQALPSRIRRIIDIIVITTIITTWCIIEREFDFLAQSV
jgi:hypothetical protein